MDCLRAGGWIILWEYVKGHSDAGAMVSKAGITMVLSLFESSLGRIIWGEHLTPKLLKNES